MLGYALLFLLVVNATGYGMAFIMLYPGHMTAEVWLVLIFLFSAVPIIAVGWLFCSMLRTAREVSRAAKHLADNSLVNLSGAMQALGAGDFVQPLNQLPVTPLGVHGKGEVGEIAANFNRIQESIATAAAAFENARKELHQSYRSLWENSDVLNAEIESHRKHEEELLKNQREFESRIGEDKTQLATLNERLEKELSAHKRSEQALKNWDQVFKNTTLGMATLNVGDDTLLSLNPAFAEMHGYHPQELVGQSLARLMMPGADEELSRHMAATGQKKNHSYETEHIRRDGTKFPVMVHVVLVAGAGGDPAFRMAYFRDITARRRTEQALKAARDEAEAAVRARSQFLARMSHELRTPLNVILGFSQLLAMNLADTEHHESMEHILKAGKHLLALINEVLDISRIEADKVSLSLQVIAAGEAMLSALALVQPSAAERRIEILDQLNSQGIKHVIADNQRLQQIFHHLLSNAVKYNKAGGRVIIWCSERAENKLAVSITDTGSGIPADKITQLFTPFERLGADQTEIEGSGLGLALSKRLAEIMDGALEVSSIPGEGSTFSVVLPMASSPVQKLGRLADERLTAHEKSALPVSSKILYIEEDVSNFRLVEQLLKPYRMIGLIFARTGQEGLETAIKQRPDMILLDLDLPDMAGEKVLEKLRTQTATNEIPVVAISANSLPRRIEKVLRLGATHYLVKPIDVSKLLVAIGESIPIRENLRLH